MDATTRETITWTLATILSLCAVLGLAVRFVLLPWLKDHLVLPVAETHRQVSENGHVDRTTPTIPDRLEDLSAKVDDATEAHAVQTRDLAALNRVLDEHLKWADRMTDVMDRELELVKDQLRRKRQNGDRT